MSRKQPGCAGFTLLEVMIALAIIAAVVFTVIGAVNHHLEIMAEDRGETLAVLLARQQVDGLDDKQDYPEKEDGTFAPTRPDYTWELRVAPTEIPGFRRAVLTVFWDGKKRSLALVRYLGK